MVSRVAKPQRDVGQEVDRRPAQQRERVHRVERRVEVRQGLVNSERAEHDAGHHGEVQVRVGVPSQRVALPALGCLDQAPFGDQGDDVEVEPPQRGCQTDPERGRDDDGCGEIDVGAGTERHDGLAESDDDHEVVPFGEVPRHQSPDGDAEQPSAPVEQDRRDPEGCLRATVDERRCPRAAR